MRAKTPRLPRHRAELLKNPVTYKIKPKLILPREEITIRRIVWLLGNCTTFSYFGSVSQTRVPFWMQMAALKRRGNGPPLQNDSCFALISAPLIFHQRSQQLHLESTFLKYAYLFCSAVAVHVNKLYM